MQESFLRASSGLRKTTLDGRKFDTTIILMIKIILQSRVNWLFGKELRIKINVRFFDLLLGGDFSAIQIINWRDVRSPSFNFLQMKKVTVGPLPSSSHCARPQIMIPSISLMWRAFNRLSVSEIKTEMVSSPLTRRQRRQINLFVGVKRGFAFTNKRMDGDNS